MKFLKKLPQFCRINEMLVKIIHISIAIMECVWKSSFSLNLVIIGVVNTAFLQKFFGANPRFPERLELFPGLVNLLNDKVQHICHIVIQGMV